MSTDPRPSSRDGAAALARKQVAGIRQSRVLSAVRYCYEYELG